MKKIKNIFIDTDMGNDDIMAISLLLLSNRVKVTGFSTDFGVSSTRQGGLNLYNLISYYKLTIPVIVGSAKSSNNNTRAFPTFDRKRAENLILLPYFQKTIKSIKRKNNYEKIIFEKLQNNTTIIALGPLTNIANLITKYGDCFTNKINEIFVMAGGIYSGNVPPEKIAEYNILLDPKAANIVFSSKIPIKMIGIDAARFAPATQEFKNKVVNIKQKSRQGKIIKSIILNNNADFDFFYDPLAVSIFLDQKIIKQSLKGFIHVSKKGKNTEQTIFNRSENGNVRVILRINSSRFYKLISDNI